MEKDIIKINNLYFSYLDDEKYQINGISLKFKQGVKVAVLGENGAGKTTLMKLICGLYKAQKGEILVEDKDISTIMSHELSKKVGYIFQNPDDQIFMPTVREEILYGHEKENIGEDRLKNIADICGLEKFLDTHPHNLPWSYRKFVSIGTVMLQNPDIFIFDEPTAGQDKKGTKMLENIIDKLQEKGKIVITITHDMDFAARNFNRIVVLRDGKVVADGDGKDIFYDTQLIKSSSLRKPYVPYILEGLSEDLVKILEIDEIKSLL